MAGELVLIVEDNQKNLKLARDLLEYRGFRVLVADAAEPGIELAREHRPDLILMDIQLPGIDGIAALNTLRGDDMTKDIRVVAVTAFAMKNDRERFLSAGFCGYLSKPIDVKMFHEQVRDFCEEEMDRRPFRPEQAPGG